MPDPFFQKVLSSLLAAGDLSTSDSILVVCGGDTDFDNLRAAGFENVTISNLDERMVETNGEQYAPYKWAYETCEALTFEDDSFDYVLVHSGLHHLRCPLKGITEMYRVSRKSVIGFEPNMSTFTKLGAKLGFGQDYEHAAVYYNDLKWGGVENTEIPNYVYRFRADDIIQTANTYNPIVRHDCRFWYATRFPTRLLGVANPLIRIPSKILAPVFELIGRLPALANNMAFFIAKPGDDAELLPWLQREGGVPSLNKSYVRELYKGDEE